MYLRELTINYEKKPCKYLQFFNHNMSNFSVKKNSKNLKKFSIEARKKVKFQFQFQHFRKLMDDMRNCFTRSTVYQARVYPRI